MPLTKEKQQGNMTNILARWGCIFWQAIALQYGKRPVYLFSIATNIVILATAPLCRTPGTYLANRILLGFFGSPVESLAEISVTDVWFVHERPKYMAFYGWSLALTGKLAPMLAGFINVGMNWEWTLRVSSSAGYSAGDILCIHELTNK